MWLLVDKGSHGNIEARTLLRFPPRHASTQPRQRGMRRHEQELSGSSFNSSPGCSRDRADTAAIVSVTADPGTGEGRRWWPEQGRREGDHRRGAPARVSVRSVPPGRGTQGGSDVVTSGVTRRSGEI